MLAAALAVSACGARGGHIPRPFPGADPPAAAPVTDPPGAARMRPFDPSSVTATALSLRGAPYAWGGETPGGFDCSGFTHYVYAQHGIPIPRVAAHQYHAGAAVDRKNVQPGDLVFFSTVAPGPSHVGLAIGGGEFVYASSGRGEVIVGRLGARYWRRRYVGARRITAEAGVVQHLDDIAGQRGEPGRPPAG